MIWLWSKRTENLRFFAILLLQCENSNNCICFIKEWWIASNIWSWYCRYCAPGLPSRRNGYHKEQTVPKKKSSSKAHLSCDIRILCLPRGNTPLIRIYIYIYLILTSLYIISFLLNRYFYRIIILFYYL